MKLYRAWKYNSLDWALKSQIQPINENSHKNMLPKYTENKHDGGERSRKGRDLSCDVKPDQPDWFLNTVSSL